MDVRLEWWEVGAATHDAVNRAINAKSKGIAPKHGMSEAFFDGLRIDILGCLGELAAAKGMNRSWSGLEGMHAPDVGGCVEVKSVDTDAKNLLITYDSRIKHAEFSVLAYVQSPKLVRLKGWIVTEEGKQDCYLREGRPGSFVYIYPHTQLRPMPDLIRLLAERDLAAA